ncbi:MAG: diguanylate cyclase [Candidatus Omnitrophica bacterium]|nr:diguanylate cyclase [Candidatus Omnitrophota bacterium]
MMSMLPMMVMVYLVSVYLFPRMESIGDISWVVVLTGVIALLGWAVARGMVMPIVRLSQQAQEIAEGHLEREVKVDANDEVGSLGTALNQITQRVRENMSQLRVYGEQTKHMNLEINRRILTMSHLLQVSSLISQSAKIEEVLSFILEKLSQLDETELNCVLELDGDQGGFVVRAAAGSDMKQATALHGARIAAPWLAKVLEEKRVLILDSERPSRTGQEALEKLFGMTQAVCQPIVSIGQGIGILISANRKAGFVFTDDCLDLLKVFGKQMTIAVENDLLTRRAEELKVIDELTGLYNASYMQTRLEEEVRRAIRYHRPCALLILKMDDFQKFQQLYGALAAEGVLHQMADLLKAHVSEVDRVGRMGADEFAVLLPEKNKREALDLADAIRRLVGEHRFTNGREALPRSLSVSVGVSENPIDGSTGAELLSKAVEGVKAAEREGKNRVMAA